MIHSEESFPIDLQDDFLWIQSTIQKGKGISSPGFPPPHRLMGITNATTSKVIEKIVHIQFRLETKIEAQQNLKW